VLAGEKGGDALAIEDAQFDGASRHRFDADRIEAAIMVAAQHKAEPAEVALAWVIAKPGVTAPIASATSVEKVASLVRSTELSLSEADMAALDQASAG